MSKNITIEVNGEDLVSKVQEFMLKLLEDIKKRIDSESKQ